MKCPICFCEESSLTLNIKGYELKTCRRCGHGPVARPVAKLFPGSSVALVCRKRAA